MRSLLAAATCGLLIVLSAGSARAADTAAAEANRRKPLQRCDQLNDKAEIECLKKARERIVEARQKREASGKGTPATDTPGKSGADAAGVRK